MICCCLSGLCPLCVKYVIKCNLFTFELTRDWVNSKVVKSEFYSWKKSKRRGMCGKFTISSLKFHVNCFQWCWTMWLEYVIKCRLFTRKWYVMERSLMWYNGMNLNGKIQTKLIKLSTVHVVQ